jgi:hypothetical protein
MNAQRLITGGLVVLGVFALAFSPALAEEEGVTYHEQQLRRLEREKLDDNGSLSATEYFTRRAELVAKIDGRSAPEQKGAMIAPAGEQGLAWNRLIRFDRKHINDGNQLSTAQYFRKRGELVAEVTGQAAPPSAGTVKPAPEGKAGRIWNQINRLDREHQDDDRSMSTSRYFKERAELVRKLQEAKK